jgi:hypothetical protein
MLCCLQAFLLATCLWPQVLIVNIYTAAYSGSVAVTATYLEYMLCCLCALAAGIPVGDLFVAMESWEEPERIKQSMDVILEIEAEAAKSVQVSAAAAAASRFNKCSSSCSSGSNGCPRACMCMRRQQQ